MTAKTKKALRGLAAGAVAAAMLVPSVGASAALNDFDFDNPVNVLDASGDRTKRTDVEVIPVFRFVPDRNRIEVNFITPGGEVIERFGSMVSGVDTSTRVYTYNYYIRMDTEKKLTVKPGVATVRGIGDDGNEHNVVVNWKMAGTSKPGEIHVDFTAVDYQFIRGQQLDTETVSFAELDGVYVKPNEVVNLASVLNNDSLAEDFESVDFHPTDPSKARVGILNGEAYLVPAEDFESYFDMTYSLRDADGYTASSVLRVAPTRGNSKPPTTFGNFTTTLTSTTVKPFAKRGGGWEIYDFESELASETPADDEVETPADEVEAPVVEDEVEAPADEPEAPATDETDAPVVEDEVETPADDEPEAPATDETDTPVVEDEVEAPAQKTPAQEKAPAPVQEEKAPVLTDGGTLRVAGDSAKKAATSIPVLRTPAIFANCAEARDAGRSNLVKGVDDEYAAHLDGDKDGTACESGDGGVRSSDADPAPADETTRAPEQPVVDDSASDEDAIRFDSETGGVFQAQDEATAAKTATGQIVALFGVAAAFLSAAGLVLLRSKKAEDEN